MAILDLQVRSRELGRIRIGHVQPAAGGKTRPAKLDRFRLTSPSRPLLDQVAHLYGGQVVEWAPQGGGPKQWEVITEATRLPVLVPPQPVTQFYELWSGGGCQRRCDGVTELLSDRPCPCGPDASERECKPTTRLNLVLRDVTGIGVWRLESHGYYAAVELPQVAQFLAQVGGYVAAWLGLEERVVKRDVGGKPETRRYMVPVLEVDITPAQLLAGQGGIAPAAVTGDVPRPAIEPANPQPDNPDWVVMARACDDVAGVRAVWRQAAQAGHLTDDMVAELTSIGAAMSTPSDDADASPDVDALWMQILLAVPDGWTTTDAEADFASRNSGLLPTDATAAQMADYLRGLKAGAA